MQRRTTQLSVDAVTGEARDDSRLFRQAAERFPGMLAIIDGGGDALYFNPGLLAYFDTHREGIDGTRWFRFIHASDRKAFLRGWWRSRDGGSPLRAEVRILHPGTHAYRRFVVEAAPLGPVPGTEDAWVVTCTDVDDLRAAEDALADANAHLRTIFESSLSSLVLADIEGRVLAVNPAVRQRMQEIYGGRVEPGASLWEVVPPSTAEVVREGLRRGQNGEAWQTEYLAKGAGSRSMWLHLTCVPVVRDGRVTAISLSAVDITDRKRAEELRRQHEDALQAEQARVEASLRDMATELEALVAQRTVELRREIVERKAMEADLEVLRQRLVEQSERERVALANGLHDDVLQEVLGLHMRLSSSLLPSDADVDAPELRREIERGLEALRSIADSLRYTIRGIKPTALDELGLRSALESFVDGLGLGDRPGVVLDFDDVEDLPREETVCLYRVGQESVRNAVKHAYAHRIVVSLRQHAGERILHVSDDGVGFAVPERLSSLVRADHFGLASIAEHVTAVGGALDVRSKPGSGTVVEARFCAPLAEPTAA